MTTPPKADPALGWLFVEDLLADEESKRLQGLSDEEIKAELRAEGIDPDDIPTPEELLSGARRRRAGGAPEPARRAPLPGNVVRLPARPARRLFWLAAAAFLLVAGGAAFAERDAIVALFQKPPPPEIHKDDVPPPDTPAVAAGRLLDEATQACATQFYGICARKVDEAVKVWPAGEDDPRVKALREASRLVIHHGDLDDKKMHSDGAARGRP